MKINYCNIFILVSWLGLSACSQDNYVENNPTNKEEIIFNYVLDSHNELSRAYTSGQYHTGATEMSDLKGILVCVRNGHAEAPEDLQAQKWYPYDGNANTIYWDDVSNNEHDVRKDAKVNIWAAKLAGRTSGTGVGQVNVTDAGTFTWTINENQTGGIDNNDLLAADYQSEYTASPSAVPLCFHHAMTKITVNIKKKETNSGFTDDEEITHNPSVTLIELNTKATVNLTKKATGTGDETDFLTNCGTPLNVQMHKTTTADGYSVSFDAIVAPGNQISVGTTIGTITLNNAAGERNTYDLKATKALIAGWTNVAESSVANNASVTLEYGVNYIINATVSKQEITFNAKVVAWGDKTGEGDAKINFTPDVTAKGSIATELQTSGFDVYKSSVNTTFGSAVTKLTYNSETSKWTYTPVIYWAGQEDASYFRALSPAGTTTTMEHGKDVLWGYACDIEGTTPTAEERAKIGTTNEVQITPRTGNVPLHFEHAMSKITVILKTSADDAKKVALDDATISISNLATDGTLNLVDGVIAKNMTPTTDAIPATTDISNYPVIPQIIDEASVLKITLADGTTYSLKLNSCEAPGGGAISNWERGKHYTYTIHLEKEAITFRALVKNWEEATGSGNATLDWD